MRIQVHGKHMDVGVPLTEHAEMRLSEAVNKYAARPVEAAVTFSKDRHEFLCEAQVHLSTGMNAQATGRAGDAYQCLDQAVARMEKQLRRYKRRLKDHHHKRPDPIEAVMAPSYVLSSSADPVEEDDEPDALEPVIIAEMETRVPSLSVGEAVMQMELAGAPVLVFKNDAHGRVNVVYRRDDGNVGWVDPD